MAARKKAKPRKLSRKARPAKAARSAGTNPKRVRAILEKLDAAYPAATCALVHDNPFQLLISTILSAQCTDVRVNQVTQTLYKKYPSPQAFAHADPRALEQNIRPTSFFRNNTKSISGTKEAV